MFRVRFHLGAGEHFMQWQATRSTGEVYYFAPDEWSLRLVNCRLRNQKAAAQKIFNGENKGVCAWIDCEDIEAYPPTEPTGERISYNPRTAPNWQNSSFENIDNSRFSELRTIGRSVFVG